MEETKKRPYSITDWMYTEEEIKKMKELLAADFKAKGLGFDNYVRATGLNGSALRSILIRNKNPRVTSLMAIDKYLKSLVS